ncbi:ICOS ligand-like isoform X2 [Onychostoma macrolepis]|uniref:ICOS ligand-like isoform X2 n=1 Tax=Onychostoma macrolepis TaxID=369639 RepID=UPI00272CDEB1|nr:ICOS ligand-like isoform X2 [Onychostoma macrolepis]
MKGSQCFICVFAVLIKVSLQVTGFIGGSVMLLCSSTEHLEHQDINVFWRHNDSKIVFDIINGNGSVVGQDQQYKNRVEPLYKDYVKRNFSIRLNDLQPSDAGEFSCLISFSDKPQIVQLIVEESTYQENQGLHATLSGINI